MNITKDSEGRQQRDIEAIERVVAALEHAQQNEHVDARYQTPNAERTTHNARSRRT